MCMRTIWCSIILYDYDVWWLIHLHSLFILSFLGNRIIFIDKHYSWQRSVREEFHALLCWHHWLEADSTYRRKFYRGKLLTGLFWMSPLLTFVPVHFRRGLRIDVSLPIPRVFFFFFLRGIICAWQLNRFSIQVFVVGFDENVKTRMQMNGWWFSLFLVMIAFYDFIYKFLLFFLNRIIDRKGNAWNVQRIVRSRRLEKIFAGIRNIVKKVRAFAFM